MPTDALLNAYFDLNILLLAGAALWLAARKLLARSKLGRAYRPQLRLLNGMTVLLAVTPVLIIAFTHFVIPHPPNFSDMKNLIALVIAFGQRLNEDLADLAALQKAKGRQPGQKAFIELGQECTASLLKDKENVLRLSHSGPRGNNRAGNTGDFGPAPSLIPRRCSSKEFSGRLRP